MTTLAEALTVATIDQRLQSLLASLLAAGVDTDGFSTYSVERALPEIEAAALAVEGAIRADAVKAGFIDLAATLDDPNWLRQLARSFYRIEWLPATPAAVVLRLTNLSSSGPFNFTPRAGAGGAVASTGTGILFDSSGFGALAAGASNVLDLSFVCRTPGSIGNVAVGTINKLQTSPFPAIGVTNRSGFLITAGREDESNSQLVTRCKTRWGTLGAGGNDDGLKYQALAAAPTVTRVFIRNDNPFGAGSIGVTLANVSGPATSDEIASVDLVMQKIKPTGSGELRTAAAPATIATYHITMTVDGTNPNTEANAQAALLRIAQQFTGAALDTSLVESAVRGGRFDSLGLVGFGGVTSVRFVGGYPDDVVVPLGSVLQIVATIATVRA